MVSRHPWQSMTDSTAELAAACSKTDSSTSGGTISCMCA
jgi:hypothetical protein